MTELKKLAAILASLNDADEIQRLLAEIMTDSERKDLDLRWRLMEMLESGQTQRDIAAELHISLCKITRGAKILKKPNSISKRLIQKT
ncbi:Trp family transcriptional regulator [Verrucomicrobiota bacterium]